MPVENWIAIRLITDGDYAISSVELLRCSPADTTVNPEAIAVFRAEHSVPLRSMLSVEELARLLVSGDAVARFSDGTIIPSTRWDEHSETFCILGWIRSGSFSFPSVSSLLARLRSGEWQLGRHAPWFESWWCDGQNVDTFWKLYAE